MLLAIDIGNTNIVLGLYQGRKLVTHWRLATQAERTADEYGVIISQLIDYSGHRCQQISAIAVSCVVPPMLTTTQELGQKFFRIDPLVVGPGIKTGMPILYENPKDVGADRIVNGIAAYEKYHDACIIVDFGTATTIDLISRKANTSAAPSRRGCRYRWKRWFSAPRKAPRIEVIKPKEVVGRNTIHSIQPGFFTAMSGWWTASCRAFKINTTAVPRSSPPAAWPLWWRRNVRASMRWMNF